MGNHGSDLYAVVGKSIRRTAHALPWAGARSAAAIRRPEVVIFLYPKDLTPAWTQGVLSIFVSVTRTGFGQDNTVVLGISNDPAERHEKFVGTGTILPFQLLADTEHKVCELYGVWQLKKLMAGNIWASSIDLSDRRERQACARMAEFSRERPCARGAGGGWQTVRNYHLCKHA